MLRYLAPNKPGVYRLSYTTYGASSPEKSDVGMVYVTVVAKGSNRDPQPRAVTARVAPGEQAETRVPLSGVDPDGDRVRLVDVDSPKDPQVNASLSASGTSIMVSASSAAKPGEYSVDYTVRDDFDSVAVGKLRILVIASDEKSSAPVASTDYVRMVPSSAQPAAVRPLDNDIDPAHGKLSIVSVVPNVPGSKDSAEYKKLAARVDLADLKKGNVSIAPDKDIGTVSYRYTIKSSVSSSTADGLIVVQTSERVGAQAPRVDDTVLNVRDRAALSGGGVDVVTDKVRWSTGDLSSLKLSLWAQTPRTIGPMATRSLGSTTRMVILLSLNSPGATLPGKRFRATGF
ncbi:hypothetical protein G7066_13665 [Leucobacter coleopterorum]|uniref:Ig-like domain (Group 3) n=1 Tax=Leucobacter coleopterorum TaxID=2714933 RepID=A0ABX6JYF8_9MICO|nr:hypothetical protein [Leucobacter coleopterorum]QIM19359.1 hypothetical protein G7066_13665 [Leucobacter coleopterorum]